MLVRDWMTRDPQTASEADTLAEVREKMKLWRCRHLPVLSGDRVVGIVTRSDVLGKSPDVRDMTADRFRHIMTHTPVAEIMTRDPVCVEVGDTIETALEHMATLKIGGLPVLDGARLAGIITETDCFRLFVQVLGIGSGNPRLSYMDVKNGNGGLRELLSGLFDKDFAVSNLVMFTGDDGVRRAVIRGRVDGAADGG